MMRLLFLATSMALLTLQGLAQESAEPEPPAVEAEASQPEETAQAPSEPAADEEEEDERSPFDYRASEQISEDLSVSFPVDI